MKFTRIISLLLVFVMFMITLASCNLESFFGGNNEPEETTTTTTTTTTPTTTTKPQETTTTTNKGEQPNPDEDPQLITVAEAIAIGLAETSTNLCAKSNFTSVCD